MGCPQFSYQVWERDANQSIYSDKEQRLPGVTKANQKNSSLTAPSAADELPEHCGREKTNQDYTLSAIVRVYGWGEEVNRSLPQNAAIIGNLPSFIVITTIIIVIVDCINSYCC